MPKRPTAPISLAFGGESPLTLVPAAGALIADCQGPAGKGGAAAGDLVAEAINEPGDGPPLGAHVVPGDHVAIAVAGVIPQEEQVLAAVHRCLEGAGVAPDDITVVRHEPTQDADTAYLAADEEGLPLYLSRSLVDADVVVAIGAWRWDAALGGRSITGELWPTFSRPASRLELTRRLAKRGRHALTAWRSEMQAITWQLGVCASLRLVAGREGMLAAAVFGLPETASQAARGLAADWSPAVSRQASLTIAAVSRPSAAADEHPFAAVTRAVAAAARVTQPAGTICLATALAEPPGVIFTRWRQGAPLEGLVREAVGTSDPQLINDALQTRLFARALGERRLVILSGLDETTVEDLEYGYAGSSTVVERLAAKAESLIVLHEADQMFPGLA